MTDADKRELTDEEIEKQRAEALPDREVMSTIQPYQIPTIEPGFGGPGVEPPPPSE
jgi:hypothetical protein